jgi:hypothetical protein
MDVSIMRTPIPEGRVAVPFRDPEATVMYHLVCRTERAANLSAVFDALPEIS